MNNIHATKMIGEEMIQAMYHLNTYAFSPSPPLVSKEDWREFVNQRPGLAFYAALENGKPISCAGGVVMSQNVRGKIYPSNGLWGVATDPAGRRKGYSRTVIQHLLADVRSSSDQPVFSALYPFRESFYQRMGYIPFPLAHIASVVPATMAPLLNVKLDGEVDRVLIGEGFEDYVVFLHRLQQQIHGLSLFNYPERTYAKRNLYWLALAKFAGETVGAMVYQLKGEEDHPFLMRTIRFYYLNSQGKYLLLQWIARHADQVNMAEIALAPFERPETWLPDLQIKTVSADLAPMGRVLDVSRLGGMQVGPGSISIKVSDPFCPWNDGVWRFESINGLLEVSLADMPDCEISIQGLSAIVYGTHNPGDFHFLGWADLDPTAQARIQAMFPAMVPHVHELF